VADRVISARRDELRALIADPRAERSAEVQQLLEQLCVELSGERP
jgi:hypothetical protein